MLKKISTLTLAIFMVSLANAQAPLNTPGNETIETIHHPVLNSKQSNRQFVSEWYNYGETIYNMGGNCDYYRNYLFPDSTVLTEFTGGFGSVWKHSYGQMCDPSSPNLINNTLIDDNADYTLDSLLIWYRYYRFQHNNPDTLIVQVFEDDKINYSVSPWSDDRSYGNVDYNYQQRKGDAPSHEYVILLGENDTSTAQQLGILVPVGINVAHGKKAAATITYFPGNPYSPGDTIDPVTTATVINKINAFAMYDYKDLDKNTNQYFYNNGMLVPSDVRYNYNANGWNGSYIAGNAYTSGYYHLDMAFKLTSSNVGVNSINENNFSVNVFPSVVSQNDLCVLQISSLKTSDAIISVCDMSGKRVFETKEMIQNGTNKISIDTDALSSGMYLVNVEVNGQKQSVKLVKF